MELEPKPQIFFSKVMHKRLIPKVNRFTYGVYYLSVPLSKMQDMPLPVNRFGILSFYEKDHGYRDGTNLEVWARDILERYNIDAADGEITLICMPRVFGYVFNPVSFWLCHDEHGGLRAVICEVNNTFGETHTYLCAYEDQRIIGKDDRLEARKLFHVSPFLKREGRYRFRFAFDRNHKTGTLEKGGAWIDYYNGDEKKQLLTSMTGRFEPMTKKNLRRAFWRYPLVTLKTIGLIHWQAVRLLFKGIKYIPKPDQKEARLSRSENIKNN